MGKTEPSRQNLAKFEFRVSGMDCAEEIRTLKQALSHVVDSPDRLSFDLLNSKLVVNALNSFSFADIARAIDSTGMKAEAWESNDVAATKASFWGKNGQTILTIGSALSTLTGLAVHAVTVGGVLEVFGAEKIGQGHTVPILARAFYLVGASLGAWFVAPKAISSLKRIRPDMNALMMIAVAGAIFIGEWFEAATVSMLFSVSLLLESWSVQRARRAIKALMDLSPAQARVKTDTGTVEEMDPTQVKIGSIVLVRPGEKLPLDGKVVSGASHVNQATITGESLPVLKKHGDQVFAGTVNGDALLEIEVTKKAGDSTLSNIIRMVSEAQSRKGKSEQWVEKFSRIYTPAVLLLAGLTLITAPLFFQGDWSAWLYRALVLLVIACPCALVISTPVSIVSSLTAAAKNGVLVKGGAFLEAISRIQAIAFDKTGTLTEGRPKVVGVYSMSGHDDRELLAIASGMESHSDHPLAKAIVEKALEGGASPVTATDFQIVQGKGASATIDGESYWLGSHRYLEEKGQETSEVHQKLEELSQSGNTVVVIGNQTHVCGFLALADSIRPGIAPVLVALRENGVRHIVMLTGDNKGTAAIVGEKLGLDEVLSELLPADKVTSIERLEQKYGSVLMVGDGINDAPALARATLGVAMGVAGSDAALETADIALMSDDLAKLPWLICHSRRTINIVRQNISASLVVKGLFVVLTALGHSSLWSAIAADMGVSLLVVFNGLRLLRD